MRPTLSSCAVIVVIAVSYGRMEDERFAVIRYEQRKRLAQRRHL